MTVTITTQGNPVNIAADSQTVSVNVTSYDTSAAVLTAAAAASLSEASAATSASQAALYDGPRVNSFAELVAMVSGQVAVGQFVEVRGLGWYQRVADASASELAHTASALKWKVIFLPGVTTKNYGAVVDGTTDDTASIRAMVTSCGFFRLPVGTSKITDEISVPATVYGASWYGEGMEVSALLCSGMTGKIALKCASANGYYRHTMRDFRIYGDADNAINLTTNPVGYIVYDSAYHNLNLSSAAGSAFVLPTHYSCTWQNVHVNSVSGHGFELGGGNSTVLINCYAHQIGAGTGKAGYKIRGIATMVGCNGVDTGDHWAIFGDTVAFGGSNAVHQINIIGGNCEDFGVSAIKLRNTGQITIDGFAFIAKATGTFDTVIDGRETGNASSRIWIHEATFTSKGATMVEASRIALLSNPVIVRSDTSAFVNYRVTSTGTTLPASYESMSGPTSTVRATKFDQLDANRFWGYANQNSLSWTANAATFAVTGLTNIKTANTGSTTFTNATGADDGQKLTIIVKDSFTTFANMAGGSGQFKLAAGANVVCASGDVLSFVFNSPSWVQQSPIVQWRGQLTYDPPSLIDGASTTTTVTVTGATLGDVARASFSLDTQGIALNAWVSAANTVSVRLQNNTGGTIDLASGTLRAIVTDLT